MGKVSVSTSTAIRVLLEEMSIAAMEQDQSETKHQVRSHLDLQLFLTEGTQYGVRDDRMATVLLLVALLARLDPGMLVLMATVGEHFKSLQRSRVRLKAMEKGEKDPYGAQSQAN